MNEVLSGCAVRAAIQQRARTVWILLTSYNEYDQCGEYFVAAFAQKPTELELDQVINGERRMQGHSMTDAQGELPAWLLKGGGRRGTEHQWFDLIEIPYGAQYGKHL